MNSTAERLSSNPFYKPSEKQKKLIQEEKKNARREPMRAIGTVPIHDTGFSIHPTGPETLDENSG